MRRSALALAAVAAAYPLAVFAQGTPAGAPRQPAPANAPEAQAHDAQAGQPKTGETVPSGQESHGAATSQLPPPEGPAANASKK